MPRRVKNPLKGTDEFLVSLSPNRKWLQVMLNYSVWYVVDLRHLECVMSASLCALLVLLYDSLNYCNKCFPSGGGPEVCES